VNANICGMTPAAQMAVRVRMADRSPERTDRLSLKKHDKNKILHKKKNIQHEKDKF